MGHIELEDGGQGLEGFQSGLLTLLADTIADRVLGQAAFNTVFIPPDQKDLFNAGAPADGGGCVCADLARRVAELLPIPKVAAIAGEVTRATRAYAPFHLQLVNVLAGSVAVQLLRVAQAYCLGLALGIAAPASAYLAFIPMILLVMLLPVTINGIGTSQVAFVWFFGKAGTPAPEAFALSVLFLGLGVLGNLPGGLLYALNPNPRPVQP